MSEAAVPLWAHIGVVEDMAEVLMPEACTARPRLVVATVLQVAEVLGREAAMAAHAGDMERPCVADARRRRRVTLEAPNTTDGRHRAMHMGQSAREAKKRMDLISQKIPERDN